MKISALLIALAWPSLAAAIDPPQVLGATTPHCTHALEAQAPDDPDVAVVRFVDAETAVALGAVVAGPAEAVSLELEISEGRRFRAIAIDTSAEESLPSSNSGLVLHPDMDGDGAVTIADLAILRRILAGLPVFP